MKYRNGTSSCIVDVHTFTGQWVREGLRRDVIPVTLKDGTLVHFGHNNVICGTVPIVNHCDKTETFYLVILKFATNIHIHTNIKIPCHELKRGCFRY